MAECIEREAMLREVERRERFMVGDKTISVGALKQFIENRPAADVAPVVHCRHCRSYNKPRLGWCSVHLDRENPDDFCSYGVRRDGDADAEAN